MAMSGARRGSREPMSKVDTAWLRMERPTNLMMITGVMMLVEPLDVERFKRMLSQRFLAFRRFRQKAVDETSGAYWETDADFDLDWHVRVTALPGRAQQKELQNLCSQLASTPLDYSKPRWQFHIVEGYGGGSALITRIHHCYADGIALVQVLLSLTDIKPSAEDKAALAKVWFNEDRGGVVERLVAPARAGLDKVMHLGESLIEKGRELINDPENLRRVATEGVDILRELAHAVSLPDDPNTRFRGPLGVIKRCAWAEPMPIDEVKIVGRALGCTVNDVLMACATTALREYLIEQGDDPDGVDIRVTVPVNLRPLEHARKLGNHFGLVFLTLPIGEPNPLRRLERIAESMRELKSSRQAIMAFGLLAALGMSPPSIQGPALELFSRKATAVATNVPGPHMPLYFAGSRIKDQMFWVPQTGSIGMGISILSYDGKVHFGLMADAKRVPDPDKVIARFAGAFEQLVLLALMADWDEAVSSSQVAADICHWAADMVTGKPVKPKAVSSEALKPKRKRKPLNKPTRKSAAARSGLSRLLDLA